MAPQFLQLDLPALITVLASSLVCALVGNYLVVRRLSLMGDALSHAVLPGIVLAFLAFGYRSYSAILIGAALAGLTTVILVERIRDGNALESSASMGVVFTVLFALGVLLLEFGSLRGVDLDADCILHGQLETVFWAPPSPGVEMFTVAGLAGWPKEMVLSCAVLIFVAAFLAIFFKEFLLLSFDWNFAFSSGFSPKLLNTIFMVLVSLAVVGSFSAVGSIVVIAALICPAASARFWTDRFRIQMAISLFVAAVSAVLGYYLANSGFWFGYQVNAAGSVSTIAGLILLGSALFSPQYGIVANRYRSILHQVYVIREDILGALYRCEESGQNSLSRELLIQKLNVANSSASKISKLLALTQAVKRGEVRQATSGADRKFELTELGRRLAIAVVRGHRLWEQYLVEQAGVRSDHVHETAETLEHFTDSQVSAVLESETGQPRVDPHGRKIPE